MKKLLLAGTCLLISNFIFSQAQLSGKITDATGKPLPGANVVLLETRQGTIADEKGGYFFDQIGPGRYTVRASYIGYEAKEAEVDVPSAANAALLHFRLPEKPILFDVLTVSATRAGEKAPFTYVNLKKEQLESRNLGQDVPYLLDATPSVVVTSDAGAGIGYTGLRIRGTDPTRINVTINGIPLNDAESQGVFWVDLPDFAASTEDIQVQRGVGTSTNGAGAFGGTINLNTNKLHHQPYSGFSGSLGSFGTQKATVQFGTGLLNQPVEWRGGQPTIGFALDGRLSRIVSDGYIDRASVDLKSFYLSGAYLGKKSSVRANVFSGHEVTYQAWNGVPAQWVDDGELRKSNVSGTEKPGTPHDNEVDDYTQTHYQLVFNRGLNRNWHLNLAGHYTRGYGFFEQYKADEPPARYLLPETVCPGPVEGCESDYIRRRWLDNHFFGGLWAMNFNSNSERLQATFSGALNQYLGDHFGEITWGEYLGGNGPGHRYYSGTGDKRDLNFFTKTQYSLNSSLHGFVDLQYRRVDHKMTGTDNNLRDVGAKAGYHFFNPKAGLLYDFGENATAYASFAVGNREPNRDDFTDAPPNARPKPERLYNTEAGFRLSGAKHALSLNFYQMQYKDQLVLTGNINDVGAAIRRNVPHSYRMGVEVAGKSEIASGLTFEANATLSQNKIKNFEEYIDNWDTWGQEAIRHGTTDIAFSPNFMAFARLGCDVLQKENQALTLALAGKHIGRQFIDNTSNKHTVLDAYFTGELQIRYVLRPSFLEEISLNLLVQNLLDAKYASNAWTYRYISSYDGRADDPFTRLEGGNTYNLTGFYPQAGRHFLVGMTVGF